MARALGDECYKRGDVDLVPADPDITFENINLETDNMLMLVSDGMIEQLDPLDLINYAKTAFAENQDLDVICEYLIKCALFSGSQDNCTVILRVFDKE